ncbi:hypothetical protein HU200_052206 [Digitaria exilis]|uniref:DNA2/NAM7 helicase helicase domain-containing protein n=1 Tax=Digitaria exilis TaxID=1010633 RepID=A0A835AZ41_9POAL|nr:hypothetical protein HU200_052206 [Digitaria exilis]
MLQADRECRKCTYNENSSAAAYDSFGLNSSQIDAVKSCISAVQCSHRPSAQLIWGPPGTGKTKTVLVMLYRLLQLMPSLRILVCAPTNTAVLQLAFHLVSLIIENTSESKELFNAVLLFGNKERLMKKAGNNKKLSKIFEHLSKGSLVERRLVLCTPFMSSCLRDKVFDILVIDEAANLKECESMIPLASRRINHVVLVGDDKQLQSVVKSTVCLHYKII